jgi:hypothetical protein
MKREVELIPATTFINQNWKALWPGSSGYESKNTPSVTLHEAWTSPLESHWGPAGQFTLVSKAAIGFEPPPTLVTYTKLTFRVYWGLLAIRPEQLVFPTGQRTRPTAEDDDARPRGRLAVRH